MCAALLTGHDFRGDCYLLGTPLSGHRCVPRLLSVSLRWGLTPHTSVTSVSPRASFSAWARVGTVCLDASRASPCPFVGCGHRLLPAGGGGACCSRTDFSPGPLSPRECFCTWVGVELSMSLAGLRRSSAHLLKLLHLCVVSPKGGPEGTPAASQEECATFGAARSVWHVTVRGGGPAGRLGPGPRSAPGPCAPT